MIQRSQNGRRPFNKMERGMKKVIPGLSTPHLPFLPVNFPIFDLEWKDAFEPAKRAAPMTRGHAMSA